MIRITAAVLLLAACASANFVLTPVEDYIKASDGCILKLKIPADLAVKLRNFDYDDSEVVQDYLLCKNKEMGIWNDNDGYDMDKINNAFKGLGAPDLAPEIRDCNLNKQNDLPGKWIYRASSCFLASPPGVLFKDSVAKFNLKPTST